MPVRSRCAALLSTMKVCLESAQSLDDVPVSFRCCLLRLAVARGLSNARLGVFAGETTVGRTDDQDVTISDPSVSGSHAAIDVVELPGGGGKRLTLKVGFRVLRAVGCSR